MIKLINNALAMYLAYFFSYKSCNLNIFSHIYIKLSIQVLRDRGQGFGILVSKVPKETNASYSLQEPAEVHACIRILSLIPTWNINLVFLFNRIFCKF